MQHGSACWPPATPRGRRPGRSGSASRRYVSWATEAFGANSRCGSPQSRRGWRRVEGVEPVSAGCATGRSSQVRDSLNWLRSQPPARQSGLHAGPSAAEEALAPGRHQTSAGDALIGVLSSRPRPRGGPRPTHARSFFAHGRSQRSFAQPDPRLGLGARRRTSRSWLPPLAPIPYAIPGRSGGSDQARTRVAGAARWAQSRRRRRAAARPAAPGLTGGLKPIVQVLPGPPLPAELLSLVDFVSDYYLPQGDAAPDPAAARADGRPRSAEPDTDRRDAGGPLWAGSVAAGCRCAVVVAADDPREACRRAASPRPASQDSRPADLRKLLRAGDAAPIRRPSSCAWRCAICKQAAGWP